MRVWDLSPSLLCRKHLLGEHRELHAVWSIIVNKKKGYSRHPETVRWVGKLKALYYRHENLILELKRRGYRHNSDLNKKHAVGSKTQTVYINSISEQREILKSKNCQCLIISTK